MVQEGGPSPAEANNGKFVFFCGCCGKRASNEHGPARAVAKAAIAVAVCVNAAFIRHYVEGAPSIKACRRCYLASTRALDLVRYAYPNAGAFLTTDSRKAVEATEVVAIGKGEHQRTLLDVLQGIPRGSCYDLNIGNLPAMPVHFKVGDTVEVAARLGPNQNKRGGTAIVKSEKCGKYCVQYTVESGEERDLPASLLSVPEDTGSKKRRSSSSSSTPLPLSTSASSESRRAVEVGKSHEKELAAMEKQLAVLRWEASKASKKERARAEELKAVSKMVGQLKGEA